MIYTALNKKKPLTLFIKQNYNTFFFYKTTFLNNFFLFIFFYA